MKLKFFAIPALFPEAGEAELNRFLDGHRISHIERQFLADGQSSYWAVCVTWIQGCRMGDPGLSAWAQERSAPIELSS